MLSFVFNLFVFEIKHFPFLTDFGSYFNIFTIFLMMLSLLQLKALCFVDNVKETWYALGLYGIF